MKTRYPLLALLLLMAALAPARVDLRSREDRLASTPDREKLPLLTELCQSCLRQDPEKALEYGTMAERILARYPDAKTELKVLDLLGQAHLYLGDYPRAQAYGERSLALSRRMNTRQGTGIALNSLAIIHIQRGNYRQARDFATQAIGIFREGNDKRALASALNNVGISYDMQGDYERALDCYLRSLKLKEEIGDKEMIARSLNNVGVIQKTLGNTQEALRYYTRALQIKKELGDRAGIAAQYVNIGNIHEEAGQVVKAKGYYQQALEIYREANQPTGIASVQFNLGLLEAQAGNRRAALGHFQKSLALRQKMGEKESVAQTLIELGKVFHQLRSYDQARSALTRGLALAVEIGAQAHVQSGSLALSATLEALQDYAGALKYYKDYKDAADKIFNRENSQKIAGLQSRYESERQEREIDLLKKTSEIQQLKITRQRLIRNLMAVGFLLLISAAALLAYRYRYLFTFWKKKHYIGHYRIIEQIGSGGMGTIYRAADVVDPAHHKSVAVKVLREEFFSDEIQKKRFKQEAALIDQVVHPHIVRVIERGETDSGLYLVMEELTGPTLTEFLKGNPKLPVPTALRIMGQIASALKSLHAMGIVHRDLKPDNIKLVAQDGDPHFVKLLDFGLAFTQGTSRLTETGIVMGTIFYLSPEQVVGAPITTASDIHSLGVICYQMLAGVLPFRGETTLEVMKQVMSDEPIAISTWRGDLDRRLSTLVMLMLKKDPAERPTATAVHDILEDLSRSAQSPAIS